MNVLITGCCGFIGFHTSLYFQKYKNFKVFGIDNFNDYYEIKHKKLRKKILLEQSNKLNLKNLDILEKNKLKKFLKNKKFDYVVHLAAQPGVQFSEKNPIKSIENNVNGTNNLLYYLDKKNLKKFILASSSSIYGDKIKSFKETDKTDNQKSIYGVSKKSCELIANTYAEIYNFKSIALRLFTVYGPFGRPDMSIYKFTKNIIEDRLIHINGSLQISRDYTHVNDVVDVISKILKKKNISKKNFEYYNVGGNSSITLNEVIKILEKKIKKKSKIKVSNFISSDIFKTKASNKKINIEINKSKYINIEKGLNDFVDWYISEYK